MRQQRIEEGLMVKDMVERVRVGVEMAEELKAAVEMLAERRAAVEMEEVETAGGVSGVNGRCVGR